MASITINISAAKYAIAKPVILEIEDYEMNKLEVETEDEFIQRMAKSVLNEWYKGLDRRKKAQDATTSEDVFD